MRHVLLRIAVYLAGVSTFIFFFTAGGEPFWGITAWAKEAYSPAVFLAASITSAHIQNKYQSAKRVRVLIVPGHQPYTGGTAFGSVQERDVVVDISDALAQLIAQNPRYEVMVARTKTAWNPILQTYFDTHVLEIETLKIKISNTRICST